MGEKMSRQRVARCRREILENENDLLKKKETLYAWEFSEFT